jgi:hypothetical protein
MALHQFDAFSEGHQGSFYRGFAGGELIADGADWRRVEQISPFQKVFNGTSMPPGEHGID